MESARWKMKITVKRFSESKNFGGSTLGLLFLDGAFECYSLEDESREVKIPGETRIPEGRYPIKIRTTGSFHERYRAEFRFHRGMLEIANIPDFSNVLIHIGNTEKDTAGCLLVGDAISNNKVEPVMLSRSTVAYTRLYKKVIEALEKGEDVMIEMEVLHGTV